jgi:cyclopropane fatty-acyl-phospholipid synthase-like methyltransferase
MPEGAAQGEFPKWDYQEYPKTLPRDDFWGQGRRTIMGRRITEDEVALIVDHMRQQLALKPDDVLLDVGCGNGALAARLFANCGGYLGVDLSEYLIGVAQEFFERPPDFSFRRGSALALLDVVDSPERFTKALCYAVLQYLSLEQVVTVLRTLWKSFPRITRVMIGNLPDRSKAALFFGDRLDRAELDENMSQIGRWWDQAEFERVASGIGWQVLWAHLADDVFNSRYRFDAILTRPEAA